ncbi:MAG: hypothetical protein AAFY41_08890 [Bacteroidota bacterium]
MVTQERFDASRAILKDKDMFKPLQVTKTIPLAQALDKGKVSADTDLLLVNHPQEAIALHKGEMAYHHIAQGEIAGEPYLVSF